MTNLSLGKKLLLAIVAFSVMLPAIPAFAKPQRDEGREGRRMERQAPERRRSEHRNHEWENRWRREHREDRFVFREPFAGPYCYTQGGYWTSDGWHSVWVPPRQICQ